MATMTWQDALFQIIALTNGCFERIVFARPHVLVFDNSIRLSNGQCHGIVVIRPAMHPKVGIFHILTSLRRHYTTDQYSRERPAQYGNARLDRVCRVVSHSFDVSAACGDNRGSMPRRSRQCALFRYSGA